MSSFKKYINSYTINNIEKTISAIVIALALLIWHFIIGEPYEWQNIEVFFMPPYVRATISLLVFGSLGAILYRIFFYKALSYICHNIFHDNDLFIAVKAMVWVLLSYTMYEIILPFVIDTLNFIASILFNIFSIILYTSPPIAIGGLGIIIYLYTKNRIQKT